jgi:hypothetical protein
MPSSNNLIQSLRSAHDPHFKLEGKVGGLEKGLGIEVAKLHKTLSKSFAMQRKTLVRVLGLEGRVGVLESQQAAEEQAQEGIDEILDEILGDSGDKPKKKKPAAKKKKRPAKPVGKKIPKKKPVAKKKKISAKDLKKGSSQETIGERISRLEQNAQESAEGDERRKTSVYQEDVHGVTSTGEQLSGAERKRRFLLRKKGIKVEDIKKGTSVQGAENVAPNNEVTDLAKRQAAGDLPQAVTEPPAQGEGQQSQLEGIKGPLKAIAESIDRIKDSLTGQSKVQEDAIEDARKSDEEKDAKKAESGLEKFLGPVKSVGEKIIAPVKSIFGQIMDFITTIILGRVAFKLFEWFSNPANTDKLTSIFKFIADWWPVLLAGIMAFLPGLLGPVGMIAGVIALLAWGIPKIINAVKSIFGFGKDIDKELKTGGDKLDKDIQTSGKEAEKKLEPGSEEESPAGVTGDPSTSDTPAELSGVQKSQQETQALAGGGPIEQSGEVSGEKGKDKVPAMLTDGEFVMSKGAVQQYGADTLAGMNAAAGGTNKPEVVKGVPRFSGGGPVGDTGSSGDGGLDMPTGSSGGQGGWSVDDITGEDVFVPAGESAPGNSDNGGGIFGAIKGTFDRATQIFNPQIGIVKHLIGGIREMVTKGHKTMHEAMGAGKIEKHLGNHAKEEKKHKLIHKRIMKTARLGSRRLGAPTKEEFRERMLTVGRKIGSGLDKLTGDKYDFDGSGRRILKNPNKDISPPSSKLKTTPASAKIAQGSEQMATISNEKSQGIPNFDASAMRSQSKIRTLGVSV